MFRSNAQRRWMYANRPDLAAEFEAATPKGAKLPEHVPKQHTKRHRRVLRRLRNAARKRRK